MILTESKTEYLDSETKFFIPYGAAEELMFCEDPEILMDGPAGTGKTRAVLEKVHWFAIKFPGMRALLVREVRSSMNQSSWYGHLKLGS